MRELITGDLHLTTGEADRYRHDFQNQLRAIIEREQVARVIILGDLTEEKDRHPAWLVNAITGHIHALAALCKETIVLQGNHDYEDIESPFFEFLKHMPRVRWIGKPTIVEDLLFLPHTRNWKEDWKGIDPRGYRFIFTHNAFEGHDQGHGRKGGGIPLGFFRDKTPVISGDIHIPQQLGVVTYVGAPYRVYYGDEYDPRLLLIQNTKVTSVKLTGPQKHSFTIGHLDALRKLDVQPGDLVKVKFDLKPEDFEHWPALYDDIRAWGEKKAVTLTVIRPKIALRSLKRKEFSHHDDSELIRAYVKRRQGSDPVLKTMLSLAKED